MLDAICSIYLITLSTMVALIAGSILRVNLLLSLGLLIWHTIACVVFWHAIQSQPVDAHHYFDMSLEDGNPVWPGTYAVASFTRFFSFHLGFSFFNCFLVFNLIGYMGLLFFAAALQESGQKNFGSMTLATAALFLPSLSLWSAAIGKDAPAFLAVCMMLYASADLIHRKRMFGLAVVIMLLVRPHIAVLMTIALAGTFKRTGLNARSIATFASITALIAATCWIALNYVGLSDRLSIETINEYLEARDGATDYGTSSIDMSNMTYPEQIFAYLFRPLFLDAKGTMWLIASAENLLLLLAVVTTLPFASRFGGLKKPSVRIHIVFAATFLMLMAPLTDNLGLAMRQKIMVLPSLLFLLLTVLISAAQKDTPELDHVPR